MTDGELTEAVREMLTSGRRMSQANVNRLVLSMLADIRKTQADITAQQTEQDKRIRELEGANIVFFIRRRPKLSALYLALLLLVLNTWFVSGWRRPVIQAALQFAGIDVPAELIP